MRCYHRQFCSKQVQIKKYITQLAHRDILDTKYFLKVFKNNNIQKPWENILQIMNRDYHSSIEIRLSVKLFCVIDLPPNYD